MKIQFIYHSCFTVEIAGKVVVFDYYGEGDLPAYLADSQIYFLNSHSHPDHFSRKILALKEQYPAAEYILSKDIRFHEEERRDWIHSVKAGAEYEIGELKIRTLKSTDVGVAFLVETDKKKIYHAGDLNWWHWQGEEKYWNNNMASNYKRSVDQLDGETLDAAFLPLDPRLGSAYYWGMKYFLEHVEARAVFPMHCWGQYEVCRKVMEQPEMKGLLETYYPVERTGQEWII